MFELTSIFRSKRLLLLLLFITFIIFITFMLVSMYLKYNLNLFYLDLSKRLDDDVNALNEIEYSNKKLDEQLYIMKKILDSYD